jgi:FkbH-like protein
MDFGQLRRNLEKDFSALPKIRVALLGDSATQFLGKAIRGYGYEEKFDLQIFEADFDQLERQILDRGSELYESQSEFIVIYVSAEKLWRRFAASGLETRQSFSERILAEIRNWWQSIAQFSKAKIIQLSIIEINDGVFGHFAAKTACSFPYQLKKINLGLMELAQTQKHVFIADVAALSSQTGYLNAHDPRLYSTAKVAVSLDFLPAVAKAIVDIIKATKGVVKKCLILDLDNTVWGGIIGDDGIQNIQIGELGMGHSFDALQMWARELRYRGIILAVCSKNDETVAKKPFQEHPDMTLRLDDIAVFVANWDNKVDNIKLIQKRLNIGFDSMVFVDDNPFERNMIRSLLPEVTVPELPEDPSLYVHYLISLNLFETASFTDEDRERTSQYRQETARTDFQKTFTSVDEYLTSLEMVSKVKSFDEFMVPRVAQLTQRSNQFNLRTVRYTESEIEMVRKSDEHVTLAFHLEDKFGDHGLVGLAILRALDKESAFIDTWIMSCRILKRGMEEFMVNQVADEVRRRGFKRLLGEYIPTAKNGMVKDFYSQMGFGRLNGKWEMNLSDFRPMKTLVHQERNE